MPPTTPEGRPSFPLNILADMAGGGLLCATGILAALFSLTKSPTARGKIVETDMVHHKTALAQSKLTRTRSQVRGTSQASTSCTL